MYFASLRARIGGLRACLLVSMMILAVTLSLSQPVQAEGEAIEASYRWISTTKLEAGGYAVTFEFDVTNTGIIDFFDLGVQLFSSHPALLLDPDTVLAIGYLPIGETASLTQSIQFQMPIEGELGISFIGEAREEDGFSDSTAVVIEQETVQ